MQTSYEINLGQSKNITMCYQTKILVLHARFYKVGQVFFIQTRKEFCTGDCEATRQFLFSINAAALSGT